MYGTRQPAENREKEIYRTNEQHRQALEFIENATVKAAQVQLQVLAEILKENAETEYFKRYNLNGRTDRESFRKCLPVITYEDLLPDISRIANGDTSPILSAHPISEFLTSSGTSSGQRKLIPNIINKELAVPRPDIRTFLMPIMTRYIQGLDKGKAMYFLFMRPETKTPSGLVARPAVTSMLKSRQFRERIYDPYNVYTSPDETILCDDGYQSMYSQMLCGLVQNYEVLRVGAIFASGLLRPIRFLEEHWKELCHDIRTGILNPRLTDSSVREAVAKILCRPNPQLADLIQTECSKGSWQGIIARLWPNTKCIDAIITGTMSQYVPSLNYYSDGIPLVSSYYGSSECGIGLNLNPLCKPSEVAYTLMPTMAYFEFLPIHRNNDDCPCVLKPVDLLEVKLGEEYELVVTTYAGLYRYRMCDVLRVSGFHNAAPQFQFVCRKGVALSIDVEKTGEAELENAVTESLKHLEQSEAILVDYTSFADISTVPGHYVLFWELQESGGPVPPSVLEECCLTIEQSLNSVYKECRVADKSIGALEIKVVEKGTFDLLMDYAIRGGSSMSQYKTPRCVKSTAMVDQLNSRVTRTHFSANFPKLAPECKQWNTNLKC